MDINSKVIADFIADQLSKWELADNNFKALAGVKVKTLDVDGMPIKVQFNPARIVSSSAKVDAKSLKERKCFLCEANRPAVQYGLEWGEGRYTVLINPFPIFPRHLTIPDTGHVDQLIRGRVADMMRLARALEDYTVFYNGPKCGASAPDHMHFQAGNSDFLTIGEALRKVKLEPVVEDGAARASVSDELPLPVIVIDSPCPEAGQRLFERIYDALPVREDETEPMMNLLCYPEGDDIRLVVIPRKQHRPSFYGTEGDDTMLISPASVDMGGVFITPLEKDFNRLDADLIRRIFDELCLDKATLRQVAKAVKV
ncbi:MAG: DUF4922 domain-containing protein [Muribaculaceae bacterium]|nr:DUF4922 domain-containing protein [Muribaculaceae bacterium]